MQYSPTRKMMLFSAVVGLINCIALPTVAYAADTTLQIGSSFNSALSQFIAENTGDNANVIGSSGDINGDGFDDFLIGAPQQDSAASNAGAAYIVYGSAEPSDAVNLSDAVKLSGESASDNAGFAVSVVGDIDGDGFDDFVVGAPYADGGGSYRGVTYVLYGQSETFTDMSLSDAVEIAGQSDNDYVGSAVSPAGDVNGDGYDDFLIAGTDFDAAEEESLLVYLMYGSATRYTNTTVAGNPVFHGYTTLEYNADMVLQAAGDMNGDGYDDIAISSIYDSQINTTAGSVTIIYGQSEPLASSALNAHTYISGESLSESVGTSLAAGDIDADGYTDLFIGSATENQYIIYGQQAEMNSSVISEQITVTTDVNYTQVELVDINADGYLDVLASRFDQTVDSTDNVGIVDMFLSSSSRYESGALSVNIRLTGESENQRFGSNIQAIGDVSGDEVADLLVTDQSSGGKVYHLQLSEVISVTGNTSVTVECAANYEDAGATGYDPYNDSDVTVTTTGSVNTDQVGAYTLVYNASSIFGAIHSAQRLVTVTDTSAPVLTLAGNSSVTINQGDAYEDAGATASDDCEGDLTDAITVAGSVDTSTAGTYTLTYSVSDDSGNAASSVSRTVTVELAAINDPSSGDGDGSSDNEESLGNAVSHVRLTGGRVRVTYDNGSQKIFKLFNISKKPKVQLHTNGDVLIAISKRYMRTFDAYTGERMDQVRLLKKKQAATKFKRYNIYKKKPGQNNVIVLSRYKTRDRKKVNMRSFVVKNGGKIVRRNVERIQLKRGIRFSALNTSKNNKNGKRARVRLTRKGKVVQAHMYRVTKKKGMLRAQ